MFKASKVMPWLHGWFKQMAKVLHRTEEHDRWLRSKVPQKIQMFHIAGVEESEPRWLKFKEGVIEAAPVNVRGFPSDFNAARTQMGEKAPEHLVPHGGAVLDVEGRPVEKPLSSADFALLEDTVNQLYQDYVFTGVRLTSEAALGPPWHARDTDARVKALFYHGQNLRRGIWHRALGMPLGKAHEWLMREHGIFVGAYPVARRQPNSPKERWEAVADSPTLKLISPWSVQLGKPYMVARYRSPQGASGGFNLAMAMDISGMVQPSKRRWSRMLKHGAAPEKAAQLQKWFESTGAPPEKWRVMAFDVSGMEKFTPTAASRLVLERLDQLLGPQRGAYRVVHNNMIVAPLGHPDDMLVSCENMDYTMDSLMGYGTRSGRADVVPSNQSAATAAIRRILMDELKRQISLFDLNGDTKWILNWSQTDDNLLATVDDHVFDKLYGKKFEVMGMTIEFESWPAYPPGKAADFLATVYHIDGARVRCYKNMKGGFINLLCSEAGAEYRETTKQWHRKSPKGDKSLPLGVGYVLRMQDYLLSEEDGGLLWNIMDEQLSKHLKMRWWDAFPCTSQQLQDLKRAIDAPESVDAIRYVLEEKPDLVHRGGFDADLLPESLQESMYIRVTPEYYRKAWGEVIPMGEAPSGEGSLLDFMPNVEAFRPFLDERIAELQRHGK